MSATSQAIVDTLATDLNARFSSCHEAFLSLDVDRTGRLGLEEIKRVLEIFNLPVQQAEAVLAKLDKSGSGFIEYADFCQEFFGVPAPSNATVTQEQQQTEPSTAPAAAPAQSTTTLEQDITALSNSLNQHYSSATKAFLKMDTDRTGKVSVDEIRALEKQFNLPDGHVDEIIASMDVDHDGKLDYAEVAKSLFYRTNNA